jgi:hypothetical protein
MLAFTWWRRTGFLFLAIDQPLATRGYPQKGPTLTAAVLVKDSVITELESCVMRRFVTSMAALWMQSFKIGWSRRLWPSGEMPMLVTQDLA